MPGLRDLFDKFDAVTQTEIDSGILTPANVAGKALTIMPKCQSDGPGCCDQYRGSEIAAWCVPPGVAQARFHVWGGGGGGAGGCCCMQGVPGGAGAYAKASVSVTQGDCYLFCAGWGGDCNGCSCLGARGCKSYVTGTNLSNFCADGGFGGKTCCFTFWRVCCSGRTCGNWYLDNTNCAEYFGADCGALGLPGFIMNYCGCGSDQNNCYWQIFLPFPGGMTSKEGGHTRVRNQGNACINHWTYCTAMPSYGTGQFSRAIGMGGISSTSCGGGSCHGNPGGPGLVKVDYK